jgi:hypothetical protein
MTASYTLTLKNSGATIQAVIRYSGQSTYPRMEKTFTKHQLADGSYAYDYPSNAVKRRWELEIDGEDTADSLLSNLVALFALKENLILDEDALIVEGNINVHFEEFYPTYQVADYYIYKVVLQEV